MQTVGTTEVVFGALAFIWFIAYGLGTPWQVRHENPQRSEVFTCWQKVTQFFAHGLGAAVGWVATYMLWRLWETRPDHFDLSYVVLLAIAYLGITVLLPHVANRIRPGG